MKIVIVDYGTGNLGSILNIIHLLGFTALISDKISDIEQADKLILPGVGSFDTGMSNLMRLGLLEPLNKKVVEDKTPILGICLGMQLMTHSSQEGTLPGLGWFDAVTLKFEFPGATPKVPHMGWNNLLLTRHHPLTAHIQFDTRFYFIHSYYVKSRDEGQVIARSAHGFEFDAILATGHIMACQFHPEKSHRQGIELIHNFIRLSHGS